MNLKFTWRTRRRQPAADESLVRGSTAAAETELNRMGNEMAYESVFQQAEPFPELEDILPHGGHDINDLRYINEVMLSDNARSDILKSLSREYKRFILWHEQEGIYHPGSPDINRYRLRKDSSFDAITNDFKDKTLTECILDRPFLMEMIWPELNRDVTAENILTMEEKTDILYALLPENITGKARTNVSEMIFRDLYQVGLDSYY